MKRSLQLPISELYELFDLRGGSLFWKQRGSGRRHGKHAGSTTEEGYRRIKIHNISYLEHRLIFAMTNGCWPSLEVDHRNLNKSDNRPDNLREATDQQNRHNCPTPKNNTSGAKGVYLDKPSGKWKAQIRINGKHVHLGYHADLELASFIYQCAAEKYYGEFACSPHRTGGFS